MTEDFLHYLWKYQNFRHNNLVTINGEPVEVLFPGYHNDNAGPDFLESKLRIGNRIWAGSVEIHLCSSDWFRHNHHLDAAYHNVILHVVYEHDREVPDASGHLLPVLKLEGRFDEYEYWRFEQLVQSKEFIPCSPQLRNVDPLIRKKMLERAVAEKLEERKHQILELWEQNKRDWINTSYQWLAYGLGLKVNAHAMMSLAKAVPWRLVAKEASTLDHLEALFFGVSGLLKPQDKYTLKLLKIYEHLKRKYDLDCLPESIWKYSRLRPPSFPDRRIAQLAFILHLSPDLPRIILESKSLDEVKSFFMPPGDSEYWQNHYRLGKPLSKDKPISIRLSGQSIDRLLINSLIPLRYTYDSMRGLTEAASECISWLDQIAPENNRICTGMIASGFEISSSAGSQGALHLNRAYCQAKKCLNCAVGIKILRS